MPRTAPVLVLALVPIDAFAFDWVDLAPGVRYATELRPGSIRVYVADIDSCAPGVHFRATSPLDGTSARVTSDFARAVGATVAINGDFFDHDFGLNVGESVYWGPYVSGWLSDGLDRATSGNFAVGADRIELIADSVVLPGPEPWMEQVVGGRWTILDAGVPYYGIADGGFVCSPGLRHPRTVIGLGPDGRHVYLLVADGRGFGGSIGMTCDEEIDLMLELGAAYAMGLDGGGSSTFVIGDAAVNNPSDGHERAVLNHLAVIADGSGPAPHCGEFAAIPVPADPIPALTFTGAAGGFVAATPTRAFDTRASTAALAGASLDANGRIAAGTSFTATSALLGLPSDAAAVAVNVTATDPEGPGYLTVVPASEARFDTSSANYAAGESVGNMAFVGTSGGGVSVFTLAASHVVMDVTGWFAPGGAGLVTTDPVRLLDTRLTGQRLAAGASVPITGALAAGAVGASLTVTAVDPAAPGFVTVYPCDAALPPTSNLNYDAGEVVAAGVSIGGGAAGLCAYSLSETDLVVDLTGTYVADGGMALSPVAPTRLLDTRAGVGGWDGRVKPFQVIDLAPAAISGFPADGGAVAPNVTVTEPTADGYVTVYPCAAAPPLASSSNYRSGQTVATFTVADLSDAGHVCVVSSASTHLVVDMVGVFAGAAPATTAAGDVPPPPGADVIVPSGAPEGQPIGTGCSTAPSGGAPNGAALGGATLLGLALARARRRR